MFDRFEIENLKILDYLKNKIVALVLFSFNNKNKESNSI